MCIFKGKVLSLPRSSCLLFSGKWRHSASRVFALLFTFVLLFGAVIPASAADETIFVSDMSATLQRTETVDGVTTWYDFDFTDGNTQIGGKNVHWFKAINPAFYASGGKKITTLFDTGEIAAGHEYEMSFYAGLNFNMRFNILIILDGAPIYNHDFNSAGSLSKVNVKFNAPAEITDNAQIQVVMTIPEGSGYGADGKNAYFYISENLEFTDLTENPTWLQKILKKFQELGETIGGFFTGLGNRIGGFFTNLTNSISQWFAEQKQQIQDFFNGVKQWFQELGDRIQQFFVDLYNDIVEGLKSLFIPSEGYFDNKKTELENFATEHFGAMYQAPVVMVDMIKKFTTMSPKEPAITLPAIQFDFQGTRYVLTEDIRYTFSWVNDKGHMLYYFYQFYRGFVTVLMFVWFGNYCVNKYNEVFGGIRNDN